MDQIKVALTMYGLTAIPGPDFNPKIVEIFHTLGFGWINDDETPWCAAFANYVLKLCKMENSGSLAARSFERVGVPQAVPDLGDIVVLWRGTRNSGLGHVGFYIAQDETRIWILGGNESGMVQIKAFSKENLLQYRRVSKI